MIYWPEQGGIYATRMALVYSLDNFISSNGVALFNEQVFTH